MNSKDGIIGLAIGDAMGIPIELMPREELIENPIIYMKSGGIHGQTKGTWSDETSMTLATMDSIINCCGISTEDMGNKLLEWLENSKYTVASKRFDVEQTTLIALSRFEKYRNPYESGVDLDDSNGNGAIFRMLPIAYYCYSMQLKEVEIFNIVKKVCCITHAHEVSVLGCYIYVLYTIKLLEGKTKLEAYRDIQRKNYTEFSDNIINVYNRILDKDIYRISLEAIRSTTYIVDTLEAVLWTILNTNSFNQAIIGAINLGNDTDAIGACTGGLAGIIYGIKSINSEWRLDLKRYSYIRGICNEFDNILQANDKRTEKENNIYGKEENIIKIIQGDITKLNVDVHVNPNNNFSYWESLEAGENKIEKEYDSKSKFVVHTMVPKWDEEQEEKSKELLKRCYQNSITVAGDFECRQIAFPCLGSGEKGYPINIRGKIAIDFALAESRSSKLNIKNIYLVCNTKEEYEFYIKYFKDKVLEKGE